MDIRELIKEIKGFKDLRDQIAYHHFIPSIEPRFGKTKRPLRNEIRGILESMGISKMLYSHQAAGIDFVREGKNIALMTPTASGKSLIYNVSVLEALLEDPEARALYIFPLKGLAQDQLKALKGFSSSLTLHGNVGEIYDGDTTSYRRRQIRENPPRVLFTNPDMLHLALLTFHKKWERFFRSLRYVVIDEMHTYNGVFGSHVTHVMRRLRRVCNLYGSSPQFITCSATIANPGELAEGITGLDFETIEESGAPMAGRHFLFINPVLSPYTAATRLFIACVRAGFKTIAFTKARKITELLYTWVLEGAPDLDGRISSYRAGFLPEERRDIEHFLFSGRLEGVISTSALELGIDIGGLDVCILVGYPGTIASMWQRSGRVGRKREALIILIALNDAIDQYFMRHPEDLFLRSHEAAIVDTTNTSILKAHLSCAVSEGYLRLDDNVYDVKGLLPILKGLEEDEMVRKGSRGDIWFPRRRNPQRLIGLRDIGESFKIINEDTGKVLGTIGQAKVFRDLHSMAIYLHRGRQYRVTRLEVEKRLVCCKEVNIRYYTSARTREETTILSEERKKELKGFEVTWGRLKAREETVGYVRKEIHTQKILGEHHIELPPVVFETKGLWMEVRDVREKIEQKGLDFAGGLHALEHLLIAALPLFAICDRNDLGGVSYPFNFQLKKPVIFIYDAYPGGVGLTERGLEMIEDWLEATLRLVEECSCKDGCPSCVQVANCGSGNKPLDKGAARLILRSWIGIGQGCL